MTITVRLSDETEAALRARLRAKGVALSDFVRDAIAEKLEREGKPIKPTPYEAWQQLYAGFRSGEADRSERAEEILRETFDAKRRGR